MPDEAAEDLKPGEWLTASSAGRRLGVHRNTVVHRAAKGEFRTQSLDGVLFVFAADVEAAVEAAKAAVA